MKPPAGLWKAPMITRTTAAPWPTARDAAPGAGARLAPVVAS